MATQIGLNEAHILGALADRANKRLSEIIVALEQMNLKRAILEGTAYTALARLEQRGYVASSKIRITSRDGRPRDICVYRITGDGNAVLTAFGREATLLNVRLQGLGIA